MSSRKFHAVPGVEPVAQAVRLRKRLDFSCGIFVVAAAAVLVGSGAAWAAPKPINILPMGDSITAQALYVNPLTTLLTNNGYAPTFLANEGHSGFVIAKQYTYNGTPYTSGRPGLLDSISTFMNHPGVNADNSYVLLMIGTNDVDTSFQLASDNVQYRLGQLISSITNIAPQSHLIVAQIVPNLTSIAKDAAVQTFNTDVAASVATAKAAGKNVSLVDMYDPLQPSLYKPYTGVSNPYMGLGGATDYLHPTQAGGDVMAQVWFDGIQAAQVPEPGTVALLSTGLASLLACAWRKRTGRPQARVESLGRAHQL